MAFTCTKVVYWLRAFSPHVRPTARYMAKMLDGRDDAELISGRAARGCDLTRQTAQFTKASPSHSACRAFVIQIAFGQRSDGRESSEYRLMLLCRAVASMHPTANNWHPDSLEHSAAVALRRNSSQTSTIGDALRRKP